MTETVHEFNEKKLKSACTRLCLKNLNNVRLHETLHKLFSVIKQVHFWQKRLRFLELWKSLQENFRSSLNSGVCKLLQGNNNAMGEARDAKKDFCDP